MVPSTFVSQPVRELSEVPRNTHHSWIIWKRDPASLLTRNGTESVVKRLPVQRSLGTNELMGEFQGFRDFFFSLWIFQKYSTTGKLLQLIFRALSDIGASKTLYLPPPKETEDQRFVYTLLEKGLLKALAKQAQHHLRGGSLHPGARELYSQNAGWFDIREATHAIYHIN